MIETQNKLIFVESELSEQVRQKLMCIYLDNHNSELLTHVDWNEFIDQWRLKIAKAILNNPESILVKHRLEKIIVAELNAQLYENQIEDFVDSEKVSLCEMWYSESLEMSSFESTKNENEVYLPLSLVHAATLLKLVNSQVKNGDHWISDRYIDDYSLDLDAYKNISELFNVPLYQMNILSEDILNVRALELLELNCNMLVNQYFNTPYQGDFTTPISA